MIALLQRVTRAAVSVGGVESGRIGCGLLILLGVEQGDGDDDHRWLVDKVAGLRIFPDDDGRMNRSLCDIGGEALVVSQFTLLADAAKGRRPAFTRAAAPAEAEARYLAFAASLASQLGRPVPTGVFGAAMAVELVNDGPVTLHLDSRRRR